MSQELLTKVTNPL